MHGRTVLGGSLHGSAVRSLGARVRKARREQRFSPSRTDKMGQAELGKV